MGCILTINQMDRFLEMSAQYSRAGENARWRIRRIVRGLLTGDWQGDAAYEHPGIWLNSGVWVAGTVWSLSVNGFLSQLRGLDFLRGRSLAEKGLNDYAFSRLFLCLSATYEFHRETQCFVLPDSKLGCCERCWLTFAASKIEEENVRKWERARAFGHVPISSSHFLASSEKE